MKLNVNCVVPAELACELGIQAGTRLDWHKGRNGELRVRPLPGRGDLALHLSGISQNGLPSGADSIGDLKGT